MEAKPMWKERRIEKEREICMVNLSSSSQFWYQKVSLDRISTPSLLLFYLILADLFLMDYANL
jgi:hypothetical protein